MLALSAALLLAASPPPPEDLDRLLARVVAAYGGEEALRAHPVRVEEGTTTSLLHPGESGRIRRVVGREGSLRVEVSFGGRTGEVRVIHQGRATRDGVDVTGTPPHAAMLLQAARLQLPLLLVSARRKLADQGLRSGPSGLLRVLDVPLPGGLVLHVAIDPETGRILRSGGDLDAAGLQFATDYGDFRKVSGILVPFHEDNFAQGQRTGETRLEKVQVRAQAPAQSFDEGRSL
jgi:hypothetical protein